MCDSSDYNYTVSRSADSLTRVLFPVILEILRKRSIAGQNRVLDLGCGDGIISDYLYENGFDVIGIDPSVKGLKEARSHYPKVKFYEGSCYEDLVPRHGLFDFVVCVDVIEHLYLPRKCTAAAYNLLKPGGTAIFTTPYNGYLKNLLISILGRNTKHADPLWDYGHIKFFDMRTLRVLFEDAGFKNVEIKTAKRFKWLAKSMIAIGEKK